MLSANEKNNLLRDSFLSENLCTCHHVKKKKHSVPNHEASHIANVLLLFGYLSYVLFFKPENEVFASQRALKSTSKIVISISLLLLVNSLGFF